MFESVGCKSAAQVTLSGIEREPPIEENAFQLEADFPFEKEMACRQYAEVYQITKSNRIVRYILMNIHITEYIRYTDTQNNNLTFEFFQHTGQYLLNPLSVRNCAIYY